jgi:hypothetical protein
MGTATVHRPYIRYFRGLQGFMRHVLFKISETESVTLARVDKGGCRNRAEEGLLVRKVLKGLFSSYNTKELKDRTMRAYIARKAVKESSVVK